MALPWDFKKQILILMVLAAIIFLAAGFFVWTGKSKGTCFDNKKNQDEVGVDCGGVCNPCKENIKSPVILWRRFFKVRGGVYEAGAFVENKNNSWGVKSLNYKFKFYDKNNILVAVKGGSTFLNPGEKTFIFEPQIETGERVPYNITLDFGEIDWKFVSVAPPSVVITKKDFRSDGKTTILEIELENRSLNNLSNIYISAAISDDKGNVFAINQTKIDNIPAETKRTAALSWTGIPADSTFKTDVFVRTDLTKD